MKTPPPPTSRASSRAVSHPVRRRHSPPPPPLPATPFHAFIAYADIPAAGRAMQAINQVLRAARQKHALKPMLWRCDQLIAPQWHDIALADASAARVVVLASSVSGELPPELEAWVTELISRQRGHPTTIVALLGDHEAWTISIEGSHATSVAREAPVEQLVA